MLNICMRGCTKAAGLAALSFSLGIAAGIFLPTAVIAAVELILLILIGYMCLFKW